MSVKERKKERNKERKKERKKERNYYNRLSACPCLKSISSLEWENPFLWLKGLHYLPMRAEKCTYCKIALVQTFFAKCWVSKNDKMTDYTVENEIVFY